MTLENTKYSETIHRKSKKCEICHKELKSVGLNFLYVNISSDYIQHERCTCSKAKEYWKKKDEQEYEIKKRKHFRDVINSIYKDNYIGRKFQEMNFENFNINSSNEIAVKIAKDYTNKCISKMQSEGLIIMGESGLGKTHLAASIANRLIEDGKIVLMGRSIISRCNYLKIVSNVLRSDTKKYEKRVSISPQN